MSEYVPRIQPVSARTLERAVIRLNTRKHPAKLAAISRELERREAERRAA